MNLTVSKDCDCQKCGCGKCDNCDCACCSNK